MKILKPKQISEIDKQTLLSQNISSVELMERAGVRCTEYILNYIDKHQSIHIFCATGNNGGDGLVIARKLLEEGFDVKIYILKLNKITEEFQYNLELLPEDKLTYITSTNDFPQIKKSDVIIDAIFGNGLSSSPNGLILQTIKHINKFKAYVIAIDMPSGLFADKPIEDVNSVVVADIVLSIQLPKLSFFLPDNKGFVKKWIRVDIDLDKKAIADSETSYFISDELFIKSIYKGRKDNWGHKGTYGHALFIGGSFGKIGASVLATKGMLRAGAGLVSAYIPNCGYTVMQSAVPEAMVEVGGEKVLNNISPTVQANAIAIGSGMGTDTETKKALRYFLKENKTPLVVDADALNIISKNKELLHLLPKKTVLTPHPKELERLIGVWENDYDKIERVKTLCKDYDLIIIVKGSNTMIVSSDAIYFNQSGNNALATGGSGDVLTGIITGLIAQGYEPLNATLLGVYLHGKTADIYIETKPAETFVASEIVNLLPKAILHIS